MSDIQDLLARLQGQSAQPSPALAGLPSGLSVGAPKQNPNSISPLASPGAQPATESVRDQNADRTTNLLNLLKFNQSTASHERPSSNRGTSTPDASSQVGGLPRASNGETSNRNQDLLLNLLNNRQSAANSTAPTQSEMPAKSQPIQAPQPQARAPFSFVSPFEKLAAASPARSPQPEGSQSFLHATNSSAQKVKSQESPIPMADGGRTRLEALLGIGRNLSEGNDDQRKETVAEAVENVSSQASRDAQAALARVEGNTASEKPKIDDQTRRATAEAAVDLQEGLQAPEMAAELRKVMPSDMAKAFTETIDSAAAEAAADSWESADANEEAKVKSREQHEPVNVYNFPMRPFTAIEVKADIIKPSSIRDDAVMKIASLKKEFDQIDRTLATASSNFIVYAMAKGGGARIIRQDTGDNKSAFRVKGNNIFNLAISAPKSSPLSSESESVLLTGTNGAVYWTSLPIDQEAFEKADLDKTGLMFPPIAPSEEPTSVSQLKTRAKRSSRHPEFFAIGRGKAIHIVYPKVANSAEYTDAKTRTVDAEKYLKDRCLKISTGKAGKDFAFSEDDTCLVSLDKAGKLKFWDINAYTEYNNGIATGAHRVEDVHEPLWTLHVGSMSEKASPTSVQFLDKDRPMTKGTALRYIIVGLKQNHTIQLWDLGLGKAVQEINLPHENDTDAICSISYNAKNGMIAIGHPTRNSIYIIHLSAPKYNLDTMSQTNFITRLSLGDMTLPRPESTAIMRDLREISLASIGHLRSMDIMAPSSTTIEKVDAAEEIIFEVYAMHSKGVTCLSLRRRDLGWSDDGKTLHAVDAQAVGAIKVTDLTDPHDQWTNAPSAANTEPNLAGWPNDKPTAKTDSPFDDWTNVTATAKAAPKAGKLVSGTTAVPKLVPKADTTRPVSTTSTPSKAASASQANGDAKSEKKKSKKRTEEPEEFKPKATAADWTEGEAESSRPAPQVKEAQIPVAQHPIQESKHVDVKPVAQNVVDSLNNTSHNISNQDMVATVQEALLSSLSPHFEKLYQRIKDDKRVAEATAAANQDAVLRLVSSTLTENVEASLNNIVSTNIRNSVTPAAANAATSSIDRKLMELVPPHLNSVVPREIKSAVHSSITQAIQSRDVTKAISEQVTRNLTGLIDHEFKTILQAQIIPTFKSLATEAATKVAKDLERHVSDQLRPLERQRQRESVTTDQLTQSTQKLLQAVESLTANQVDLHKEITALKKELAVARSHNSTVPQPEPEPVQDEELKAISALMAEDRKEDAVIRWLQSERQSELFDKYFARWHPSFLTSLNSIVLFSLTMALSSSLKTNTAKKLDYIAVVLQTIDVQNSEIAAYAPQLLELLNNKLQDAYMDIAGETPQSPLLQQLRVLIVRSRDLKASLV